MPQQNFRDRTEAIVDLTKQAHAGILSGTDSSRILTFGIFVFGAAAVLYGVIICQPADKQAQATTGFSVLLGFGVLALVIYAAFALISQRLGVPGKKELQRNHDQVARRKREEGRQQRKKGGRAKGSRRPMPGAHESDDELSPEDRPPTRDEPPGEGDEADA